MKGPLVLLGTLLSCSFHYAEAANWSFDPKVEASGVYNDNLRMSEDDADVVDVTGAKLDARLAVKAETQRSSFSLTPRLRSTFYPGDDEWQANDGFVRMAASHWTERSNAEIVASYSSVATVGEYFPDGAVGDGDVLGDPDPGVGIQSSGLDNREDRLLVTPTVTFELNPRHSLEFVVDYLDVNYDSQDPGYQEDFQDIFGSVSYHWSITPTATLALRGGYGNFNPSSGDSSDAQLLDAEWRNSTSDTTEVYLRGGVNRVETIDADGSSDWQLGFTGGTGVRWTFEVTDVWLDLSQNLDPNETGELRNREQLRLELRRRIAAMTRIFLNGRLVRDSAAADEQEFETRTYLAAGAGIQWQFAKDWTVVGSYNYRHRQYEDSSDTADSNAFSLGVVYEPKWR